ncbi:hemerythrin domain-containing protein [Chitinolyticbacter meiyuanensis]|uniref:hemerythrin domain-containing protein n=1 Tax=Chitinolyticbacter meiyuanensis TaxID=682798 RepID=UPI0011E5E7F1|nr:hemerythrin domain-containing protein [Chitinolyticbacter meiyuanensis]
MKSTSTSKSSSTSRRTSSRATGSRSGTTAARRAPDAVKSLKNDHAKVKALFKSFEAARSKAEKAKIAAETCLELTVHTRIEEEVFYPAVRKALQKEGELLDEAEIEHASVKTLIEQLKAAEPGTTRFNALYDVIREYVLHHVKEEEREMFPKVKEAKSLDLQALGEQLEARREAVRQEELSGEGSPQALH